MKHLRAFAYQVLLGHGVFQSRIEYVLSLLWEVHEGHGLGEDEILIFRAMILVLNHIIVAMFKE